MRPDPIQQFLGLITLSVVCIVCAAWKGFFGGALSHPIGLMGLLLILFGCLPFAIVMRSIGRAVMTDPDEPWYARRGSPIFLTAAFSLTAWLLGLVCMIGHNMSPAATPLEHMTAGIGAMGIVAAWIVLLDRPAFNCASSAARATPRSLPISGV